MSKKNRSKAETMIKLILVFTVSLLSFSVGTFVGKQFSDSQYRMASLEEEYYSGKKRSTASSTSNTTKDEEASNNALTDEDIASLTEEFVNAAKDDALEVADTNDSASGEMNESKESKTMQQPVQQNAKKEMVKKTQVADNTRNNKPTTKKMPASKTPAPTTIENVAERVAMGKTPTTEYKAPKKRHPSSLPKTVANNTIGKYTVQIASYSSETDAKVQAQKLIKSGFSAFYLETKIKGKSWYRVNVGLFGNKQNATEYRKTLLKEANLTSAFIQKIVK